MIFPGMQTTVEGYKVEEYRAEKLIKKKHHENSFGNMGMLNL